MLAAAGLISLDEVSRLSSRAVTGSAAAGEPRAAVGPGPQLCQGAQLLPAGGHESIRLRGQSQSPRQPVPGGQPRRPSSGLGKLTLPRHLGRASRTPCPRTSIARQCPVSDRCCACGPGPPPPRCWCHIAATGAQATVAIPPTRSWYPSLTRRWPPRARAAST